MQWCGQVKSMIYQKGRRMPGVSEKVFNKTEYPENLNQKIDGQHSKPCLPRIYFDMKKNINLLLSKFMWKTFLISALHVALSCTTKKAHLVMQVAAFQFDDL